MNIRETRYIGNRRKRMIKSLGAGRSESAELEKCQWVAVVTSEGPEAAVASQTQDAFQKTEKF